MVMVNLSKEFGFLVSQFRVGLFILKRIYRSMVHYLINCLSVHFVQDQKHQSQTLIYITFSFGIVWTTMLHMYTKAIIGFMTYEAYTRDAGKIKGSYIATLDNYHGDIDTVDFSTSETHKSITHNLLELENGQYCLYPNNRMRVYDNSLTPENPKTPDFLVSTKYYQVENEGKLERFGDSNEYFYKSKKEK